MVTYYGYFMKEIYRMKQDKIKPMLFSVMKNYDGKKFVKDVVAGIIVAIIALPLSIALALAWVSDPSRVYIPQS